MMQYLETISIYRKNAFAIAPKIDSLNVQKCDTNVSKKSPEPRWTQDISFKSLKFDATHRNTQTLSRKVWGSEPWRLQPFVEHSCVKLFEEVYVVLNALLVALWLVQTQLQVLQTHLKLFLSLRV